jgi:hypothetical protein
MPNAWLRSFTASEACRRVGKGAKRGCAAPRRAHAVQGETRAHGSRALPLPTLRLLTL